MAKKGMRLGRLHMGWFFTILYLISFAYPSAAEELGGNVLTMRNYEAKEDYIQEVPLERFGGPDLYYDEFDFMVVPAIDISGKWKGKVRSGGAVAKVTMFLSQNENDVTGIWKSPGAYPTKCGIWTGDIWGTVSGNIFSFEATSPVKDLDTCEVICIDPVEATLTIDGDRMTGTGTEIFCIDNELMHLKFSLRDVTPEISFLDKDNPSREVIGAAADGASEVIIQITNVRKKGDVEIHIEDGDGWLKDDARIRDGVFTQTYVAPEYFVKEDQDLSRGKREVKFMITVKGDEFPHPEFYLIKPPIVLLHGLWSDAKAWKKLESRLVKEHGYTRKYVVNQPYPNSVAFDRLASVISFHIGIGLRWARMDGYVAKKADVVAHSMGGLITKLFGKESIIRSITTVGTPHFGSPLADILWWVVNNVPYVESFLEESPWPAKNGAIEDLRVNDGHHCLEYDCELEVPNYVIAGISPLTNESTVRFINFLSIIFKLSHLLSWSDGLLDLNQLIFEGERNDWAVAESSQEGYGYWEGDDDYVSWHCGETMDAEILDKIVDYLHYGSGSSASAPQTTWREGRETWELGYEFPPVEIGVSSGQLQITQPTEGQVFQPGDLVSVEVDSTSGDAMVVITTSTGESSLMNEAPYTFQFVIPEELLGPLKILAGGEDASGYMASDEVTINVSTSSRLIELIVYPDISPLYLHVGTTLPLVVDGLYEDGVVRDITSSQTGTSYTSSIPGIVGVSPEGVLTAKSLGEATVTIENSGVRKEITVIGLVEDPNIKVILSNPNGGEVIPSGSTYSIQWGATSEAASFDLSYSTDNGATWEVIARGIEDMSYTWDVPIPKKTMKKCLVKVIGYDGSDAKVGADKSDAPFTIEVVKLTSPNGGETLISGSTYPIEWDTHGTKKEVGKVKLLYTKNGGRTWKSIETVPGDPGIYDWTVPDVPRTKSKCRVKVVLKDAKGNTVGSDTSDGYFTIEP